MIGLKPRAPKFVVRAQNCSPRKLANVRMKTCAELVVTLLACVAMSEVPNKIIEPSTNQR